MAFYPEGAAPPDTLSTPRLGLRPLSTPDVELDYAAVMSDPAALRRWSQSSWPADDFTLEQNLEDLARHEREHRERVAFTYTVSSPDGTRCLGCVYFTPVRDDAAGACAGAAQPVQIGFWVRAAEVGAELDRHLLESLRAWLRQAWAFDAAVFVISAQDERQVAFLGEMLAPGAALTLSDGRACWVFAERIERPDAPAG